MGDVVVFGSINVDLVLDVPSLPGPGQTVLGGRIVRHGGGKGANQAAAAASLGASAQPPVCVRMVGRVGADADGARLCQELAMSGVDVTGVLADPAEPTGTALIMVDAFGENLIGVGAGANAAVTADDAIRAVQRVGPGDVLVCQLEIPYAAVERAVRSAAAKGALVVLNAAPPVPIDKSILQSISLLVVNEAEAFTVLGIDTINPDTVATASVANGCAVVVTLGGDGAILAEPSAERRHLRAPVVEALDTTGAGDTFVGACAVRLALGASLPDAVTAGVAAGAFAVTRPGARNAPDATQLAHLMAGAATVTRHAGVLKQRSAQ